MPELRPKPTLPRRVLLVEDCSGDARLLGEMLAAFGNGRFELEWVSTLGQAFDHLETQGSDVLLLDLYLPESSGLETFQRVKERAASVPVVVMTGLDDRGVAEQAAREGAQDYLVKGEVTGELLCRALHYAIERHRIELQLQMSQRMEAIGQLAGGVAHDFNNLLVIILLYSDLLLRRCGGDSYQSEGLTEIKKAAEHGASLTQQLLTFSRQQVRTQNVLSVNSVVRNMESLIRPVIGEAIELEVDLQEDLGHVRADRSQIEQILMNLAVNARDAISGPGRLTIATRNVEIKSGSRKSHRVQQPGMYTLLSVSDTGAGMDPETERRIFEPFFTTKREGQGTGLGLSTLYGIVKQSGGYVWVDTAPGEGTTFEIYLASVDAPEDEGAPRSTPAKTTAPPTASETLLLVEDDPVVRRLSRTVLEEGGYRVLDAGSAADAIDLFHASGDEISLLITDVVMPHIGGPALAKRLSEISPEIKVLYLSGYAPDAVLRHGLPVSQENFLQKPFRRHQLLGLVDEILHSAESAVDC